MIDILIPVLSRPHRVIPLVDNIMYATEEGYRILFITSAPDVDEQEAVEAATEMYSNVSWACTNRPAGPGDYANKINIGAAVGELVERPSEWIFTGADDLSFHPGWDSRAYEYMEQFPLDEIPGVVGTNDLGNSTVMAGRHATHLLVSREYYRTRGASWNGPGSIYYEGYDHQYCDTELVAVAQQRNEWGFAKDSIVEHMHPFWGKGEQDATYEKGLAQGREDGKLFHQRLREFG